MTDSRHVEQAVIEAYVEATGLGRDAVVAGLDGSDEVPFDSVLGVELIVAMEGRFGVSISEDEEGQAKNFQNLRSFSKMVERYVQTVKAAR
jgi:acyl carrier protein